eukprot:g3478.t1
MQLVVQSSVHGNGDFLDETKFSTLELLSVLERILFHGLKDADGRGETHFWYLLEKLEETDSDSFSPGLMKIRTRSRVRTRRGKCRAWIRVVMNQNSLEYGLRTILDSGLELQMWYEPWATIRSKEIRTVVLPLLGELNDVGFALNADSDLFDSTQPGIVTSITPVVRSPSPSSSLALSPAAAENEEKDVDEVDDASERTETKRKQQRRSVKLKDLLLVNTETKRENNDEENNSPTASTRGPGLAELRTRRFGSSEAVPKLHPSTPVPSATAVDDAETPACETVVVTGAGMSLVDGRYARRGTKCGAHRFESACGRFEIFRYTMPTSSTSHACHYRWYIGEPLRKRVFYYADVTSSSDDPPGRKYAWLPHPAATPP